jgi:hypothetical protein
MRKFVENRPIVQTANRTPAPLNSFAHSTNELSSATPAIEIVTPNAAQSGAGEAEMQPSSGLSGLERDSSHP